jgi:anti-sigma regulatory factor (Ser/Thr protein kinase)
VNLRVPLGSRAEDLPAARRAVAEAVARCHADVDVTEVMLLADELVSNALRYAGGASEIGISGSAESIRVEVIDPSPALPALSRVGPRQDRGRGLLIVEQLASAWGADPLPIGGKSVWFEVHTGLATGPGS